MLAKGTKKNTKKKHREEKDKAPYPTFPSQEVLDCLLVFPKDVVVVVEEPFPTTASCSSSEEEDSPDHSPESSRVPSNGEDILSTTPTLCSFDRQPFVAT